MSPNWSGVWSRPSVVIGSVNCVPGGDGSRPSRPAGFVAFCSWTAAETSETVTPSCAIFDGSSWSSIEKSRSGNGVTSPIPDTRFNSSTTLSFM